jgi:hypothetical protein
LGCQPRQKEEAKWAFCALETVSKKFPEDADFESWPLCALYLPHVNIVLEQRFVPLNPGEGTEYILEKAYLLNCTACFLRQQGQQRTAMPYARKSLEIYGNLSMGDCIEASIAKIEIARLLSEDEDYNEAEWLCRQALEGLETQPGSEHLDTLEAVKELAYVLSEKGARGAPKIEAEILARRAVRVECPMGSHGTP